VIATGTLGWKYPVRPSGLVRPDPITGCELLGDADLHRWRIAFNALSAGEAPSKTDREPSQLLSETNAPMKVTQEKLPASQVGLEIEIPPEMSTKTYERVIQDLSRTANIPGFRKGKVPRQILLQRLGTTRIKAATLEDLIQNGLEAAIKQESIPAIGNYQLLTSFEELITQFKPGEPLTYKATVDVEPAVQVSDYKGLSVQAEEVKPDSSQVDKFLEQRRGEQATLIPVEGRPAQQGDMAVVDYSARFASDSAEEATEEVPGAQATDFQVELVEGKFIPGFIEGIFGMNLGETKEVTVKFPDDYTREDLAGRSTIFTITLQDLKEKELPPLDDDFAQEVSEFQTLAELRESVESKYKEDADKETKANKEQALLKELLNHVEMEIPETLIEREVEYLLKQMAIQLGNYGLDVKQLYSEENLPQMRERSRPEAIERIKQARALQEIAKLESIEPTDAEIDTRIEEVVAQLAGQSIDPVRVRDFVQAELQREKTLEWLAENANIELLPEGSLTKKDEAELEEEATAKASEQILEAEVTQVDEPAVSSSGEPT
jgi:trigger factor